MKQIGTSIQCHEGDETAHTVSHDLNPSIPVLSADRLKELDELHCILQIVSAPVIGECPKDAAGCLGPIQERSINVLPSYGAEWCPHD